MNTHANTVIDALGGTAPVARLFGVSMPSVSDWRKNGIPRARMMFLRVVKKKELTGLDLDAATSIASAPGLSPRSTPAEQGA